MEIKGIRSQLPYLDISELLLKELSPFLRPQMPEIHETCSPIRLTPKLSPLLNHSSTWAKTPLAREIGASFLERSEFDDLEEFCLEGKEPKRSEGKTKKIKKFSPRPRLNSTWHFSNNDLEEIVESNQKESEMLEEDNYSLSEIPSQDEDNNLIEESFNNIKYFDNLGKEIEEEKQSTTNFDMSLKQEPIYLEWHCLNPMGDMIFKLKSILGNDELKSDEEKLLGIKNTMGSYIFDHEKYYFDESINQMKGSVSDIINKLVKGIEDSFKRNIRGLTFEKRRLKLVHYMEKKRRRVWNKKVNYDCRKKVADGRLRIKGKFVTHEQAREQLGVNSLEGYNADEIREMLEKKAEPDC